MSDEAGRAVIADLCRIPNPEAIDRTAFVELGGVEQFVSIRGRSTTNPVLIVCHGGPALPSLPSSWIWQRGVEDYFTVVNYDQRASGKSVASLNDEIDLSVDRYVADLVELIAWLQSELGVTKVGLLGHSWGSIIGVSWTRGGNGAMITTENSGHFWRNWTPAIRQQFVKTMQGYGFDVLH